MAKKNNNISVTAFEKAIDKVYTPQSTVEWNGLTLVIKRHLSLAEVVKFVDVCVKACFNNDNASYTPEAKVPAIRSCIVAFYTNITLPENVEKQYDLIYHSMIMDYIVPYIDQTQLDTIIEAIDDKIEHLAAANLERVNKQMADLNTTLESMQKQITDVFDGVSAEDMKHMVDALSAGIDEEKLVKAYMSNKE